MEWYNARIQKKKTNKTGGLTQSDQQPSREVGKKYNYKRHQSVFHVRSPRAVFGRVATRCVPRTRRAGSDPAAMFELANVDDAVEPAAAVGGRRNELDAVDVNEGCCCDASYGARAATVGAVRGRGAGRGVVDHVSALCIPVLCFLARRCASSASRWAALPARGENFSKLGVLRSGADPSCVPFLNASGALAGFAGNTRRPGFAKRGLFETVGAATWRRPLAGAGVGGS